jgi:uncharacterized RDD family membrane protein YckC
MRCPKCGYNSFDHLENCKKCGKDLSEHKSRFGIKNILLSGVVMAAREAEAPEESIDFDVAPEPVAITPEAPPESSFSETDDLGFDFMGDSEDEESLAFDELFEETSLEDDIDETLPAPDQATDRLPDAHTAFDPGEPETLDSDFNLASPGGSDASIFDLNETESPAGSSAADADLELDSEIDFADFDEDDILGTTEDPDRPFDCEEVPARGESPTAVDDDLPASPAQLPDTPSTAPELKQQPPSDDPMLGDDDFEAELFADDEALPLSQEEPRAEPPAAPQNSFAEELVAREDLRPADAGEIPAPEGEVASEPPPARPVPADDPLLDDDDFQTDLFADDGDLLPLQGTPYAEPPLASLESSFGKSSAGAPSAGESDDFSLGALPVAPLSAAQEMEESERPDQDADASHQTADATEEPGSTPPPFARRISAFLCDMLLLGLVGFCFVIVAETALSEHPDGVFPSLQTLIDLSIPYFLVVFCLTFGYFTLFHFLTGQTPGKMVTDIQVETTSGESLALSEAFMRSVGGLIQVLPAGLGSLSVLLDRDGRGWNDRLAGTRLVDLKSRPEPPRDAEGLAEAEED